jgi:hypothetical protein
MTSVSRLGKANARQPVRGCETDLVRRCPARSRAFLLKVAQQMPAHWHIVVTDEEGNVDHTADPNWH